MSADKFSSGLWRIDPLPLHSGGRVISANFRPVATVHGGRADEQSANVRLIVSAPDLLCALRRSLDYVRTYLNDHPNDPAAHGTLSDAVAAINRVEYDPS